MRIPILLVSLSIAVSVPAFQGYQGSRFGHVDAPAGMDGAWGIARSETGYFVVGNADDSVICNLFDSTAERMCALLSQSPIFLAWNGRLGDAFTLESSNQTWSQASTRWFGLEKRTDGRFLSIGTIRDTVFFDGKSRSTLRSVTPDAIPNDSLYDPAAILPRGGGGGIGVARWSASGSVEKLSLFRAMSSGFRWQPVGWDIHSSASGSVTIAGTMSFTNASELWIDSTKFQVPAGSRASLAGLDSTGKGLWFRSSFPCLGGFQAVHARTANGLWLAQGDSVYPRDSSNTGYGKLQPILVRYDSLGQELSRSHPLGTMRGGFFAIGAHENGSLLLSGQQASDLSFQGAAYPLHLDTATGLYGMTASSSAFLLLTDSLGKPVKYKSLSGIGYVGDWKVLRAPGKGWLVLGWDQRDMLGWARLFLLNDSLDVIERSDSLPPGLGISLDGDSGVLLSGRASSSGYNPIWLQSSGSMWAGSVRFGSPAVPVGISSRSGVPLLHRQGNRLIADAPCRLEIRSIRGELLQSRAMVAHEDVELPCSVSVVRIESSGRWMSECFVRW
jgi:hypothetical protein